MNERTHTRNCICDLAQRSFRDVADQDYIAARICYKNELPIQFLWSALQAVEKYLKAILIFNEIDTRKMGHDLVKGLNAFSKHFKCMGFELDLSHDVRDFIEYLNDQGENRYLDYHHYTRGNELLLLDKAVWEIRKYCIPLDGFSSTRDESKVKQDIIRIQNFPAPDSSKLLYLTYGGYLGKIMSKNPHPHREPLLWCNQYFRDNISDVAEPPKLSNSINPPLTLRPECFDAYKKLVKLSPQVAERFKNNSAIAVREISLQNAFQKAFKKVESKTFCNSKSASSAWIKALADMFRKFYSKPEFAVFSRDFPQKPDIFKLNELLFDITVVKLQKIRSAKNRKLIEYISDCEWAIESEFSNNSRDVILDLSKLFLSSAKNKLIIISNTPDMREWALNDLVEIIPKDKSNYYLALMPHPSSWHQNANPERLEVYKCNDNRSKWISQKSNSILTTQSR